MSTRIQHILVTLLVFSYLFVGVTAHLDALNAHFIFRTDSQRLVLPKSTPPVPAKVCWTQYKHIPSVTKMMPTSATVLASDELPGLQGLGLISVLVTVIIHPAQDVSVLASRAPPKSLALS
jgi:hypothetical protein